MCFVRYPEPLPKHYRHCATQRDTHRRVRETHTSTHPPTHTHVHTHTYTRQTQPDSLSLSHTHTHTHRRAGRQPSCPLAFSMTTILALLRVFESSSLAVPDPDPRVRFCSRRRLGGEMVLLIVCGVVQRVFQSTLGSSLSCPSNRTRKALLLVCACVCVSPRVVG